MKNSKNLLPLLRCGAVLLSGGALLQLPLATRADAARVAVAPIKQEGPPVLDGERVLFRFHAPAGTKQVFLAGSFNGFANNTGGAITDPQFALTKAGDDFSTRVFVELKTQQYKYVVLDALGQFNWLPDPFVKDADQNGNSVLDFGKIARLPPSPNREGAPLREGDEALFRFRAPQGTTKVFLAGSFNGYANNRDGVVTDAAFAMTPDENGLYLKRVRLGATTEKYKFVVVDKNGKPSWVADPSVKATDDDGNSVVDFGKIERLP